MKLGQQVEWILVFPLESFHTRNLITSLGEAELGELEKARGIKTTLDLTANYNSSFRMAWQL